MVSGNVPFSDIAQMIIRALRQSKNGCVNILAVNSTSGPVETSEIKKTAFEMMDAGHIEWDLHSEGDEFRRLFHITKAGEIFYPKLGEKYP